MKTKIFLMAVSAALIGLSGTVTADPKDPEKAAQVMINRQANCGYGAGNNVTKWEKSPGFKNLGERLDDTVVGTGGPGGDGYGEKPLEPYGELDPGNSRCGEGEPEVEG